MAAAAGLALLLWLGRERIGRGPLAEALYFALTLGPVLGFVDYGYMQFSFVADRFQYLAGSGVLAVLIGAAAHGVGRLRAGERDAAGVHEASVAVLRLDALLPSTGSGAATVPPLHQYYGGAKTPSLPFSPRFVAFAWRYHAGTRWFAPVLPRMPLRTGLDFALPASLRLSRHGD